MFFKNIMTSSFMSTMMTFLRSNHRVVSVAHPQRAVVECTQ